MYSNSFDKIFKYVLMVEGGYTDDAYDAGGKTNWGIIEEEARRHGYRGDMRNLTKDMAKEIYFKDYFKKNRLDEIKDEKIQLSVFDWLVNSGKWGAVYFQRSLNRLGFEISADGIIGSKTIKAANEADPAELLKTYHAMQREYYNNIVKKRPLQRKFLKGWLNRVDAKEKFLREAF